jgi:hypothetical protein
MIYRRPISLVVPDPQSLTEKTKETDRKLKNNRHLLTGQSIPGAHPVGEGLQGVFHAHRPQGGLLRKSDPFHVVQYFQEANQ